MRKTTRRRTTSVFGISTYRPRHLAASQSPRPWRPVSAVIAAAVLSSGVALSAQAANAETKPSTCLTQTVDGWQQPLAATYRLTSPFGMREHPVDGGEKMHNGVDLASRAGDPIRAAADGRVVRAGAYGGLGISVEIRHPNGLTTIYGHMSSLAKKIKPGKRVQAGRLLGFEGATGKVTGAHLHFEVRRNGEPIDPTPFLALQNQARGLGKRSGVATRISTRALPAAGTPRKASLVNKPVQIPQPVLDLYLRAAKRYDVPWTLLAGIGMAESAHGLAGGTSTAGAKGLMQFMPRTWRAMGVDGNGDGQVEILDNADSVMSAANYLVRSGVRNGDEGVRRALLAYNHADWYVNDVLYYAAIYSGSSPELAAGCGAPTSAAVQWATSRLGDRHKMGSTGPNAWDGSSFVQRAYDEAGFTLPRTAQQQRDWLAGGHGTRVKPGQEQPGDLIFYDSYRGPHKFGDVAIIVSPDRHQAIYAGSPRRGVAYLDYERKHERHSRFEIWRVLDTKP